jgi:HK97 family phage prohead protease
MEHVALKATTTATDQELGTFEALASAWAPDRERDVISRHAFDKTIKAWRESGKRVPLLLNHTTTVVGHVDPDTMQTTDEGLVVSGEVDRSSEEGRMVWRTIKSGTAGFSIGYSGTYLPLEDGGRVLVEVDLLEVSATSTPMHPATRALSWKSEDAFRQAVIDILTEGVTETKGIEPLKIATFEC